MGDSALFKAVLRQGRFKTCSYEWVQEWIVGFIEGRVQAGRENLLIAIEGKFGFVPPTIASRIRSTSDIERLRTAIRQVFHVECPDDLGL